MAATLFPTIFLASGGILFAFDHSTLPGKLILFTLFIASIFSWAVMVTKFRLVRRAQVRRAQFLESFRSDRQPLRIYTDRTRYDGAPVFAVYRGRPLANRDLCATRDRHPEKLRLSPKCRRLARLGPSVESLLTSTA